MKSWAVSIIVPIYNVEQYIEKCVISLFEQDFENIEYIFVNDCTPDSSMDILKRVIEQYPNRKSNCKIIELENNKGSGEARKTGVENASGDYIIHVDSDDWCELDMISSMYTEAKNNDLDIVVSDYYMEFKHKTAYVKQYPNRKVSSEYIFMDILSGDLDGVVWNKLVRRSIYINNDIMPINIAMAEDKHLMIRLFFYSTKIEFINKAFYHYNRVNENSVMSSKIDKSNDLTIFIQDIENFLKSVNSLEKYKQKFYILIMQQYHRFRLNNNYFLYENYPEAIKLKYLLMAKNRFLHIKVFKILFYLTPNFIKIKLINWYKNTDITIK